MTYLTWDFGGLLNEDFEGDFMVSPRGDSKGDFRGDFKQDFKVVLLKSAGQVRSGSVLVQFRGQIYFFSV